MDKKVALVTGCTTGSIGFAYSENLLRRGYTVYVTSRSVETIVGLDHPQAKIMSLDVTNDQEVGDVVGRIIENEGQIDLLINNVGILSPGPIIDHTVEEMKVVYDINVFSILRLCRAVIPHMAKRKEGLIVNMGSIVGSFPTPWMGVYDSSKSAVRILTEVLSLETRPFDIKVVLVEPAAIKSKLLQRFDNYKIPEGSIYIDYQHNVRDRLDDSKKPGSTPPEVFAERVLTKVLTNNPPRYILTGYRSNRFRISAFLPRSLYLNIVWAMYSKPKKKSKTV